MEINLIVTDKCNLSCTYCYEKNKRNQSVKRELVLDTLQALMKRIKDDDLILDIQFHGGEPLIEFPFIQEVVAYIDNALKNRPIKIRYGMTTNGILLNKSIVQFLIDNKFNVSISLDGKEESHNRYRVMNGTRKGSFTEVMDGLNLVKNSQLNPTIRMTVQPKTACNLYDNVIWLVNEGFDKIESVCNYFEDWDNETFNDLKESYYKLKDWHLNYGVNNNIFLSPFDGKLASFIRGESKFCNAGFEHYAVDIDGLLYPCTYVYGDKNFCIDRKEDKINTKQYVEQLKLKVVKNDKCEHCNIAHFCHGRRCGYMNYVATGLLTISNEFTCRHEQMLFDVVSSFVEDLYEKKDRRIIDVIDYAKKMDKTKVSKSVQKYIL